MKSKEQLKEESVQKFKLQIQVAKKDIVLLNSNLDELDGIKVNEASAEVINILQGIRRDLSMCSDSAQRIKRLVR